MNLVDQFGSASFGFSDDPASEDFSIYHFSEVYDQNKEYPKGEFTFDYGHGVHQYKLSACELTNTNDKNDICIYVYAKEVISENERKKLEPYCQCEWHQLSYFNPLKYHTCPHCVGCLMVKDPGYHSQRNIDLARQALQTYNQQSWYSYLFGWLDNLLG